MEYFDIIDKNDKVIGKATRDECHSDPNLIHRAVHFTLIDNQKNSIFITQRSLSKKTDPGKLCFLGEHIISGETWEKGLKRGVKEELGFTPEYFTEVSVNIFNQPNQTELVRFYAVYWNNEKITFDANEIENFKWVDIKTLLSEAKKYSFLTKYWVEKIDWDKITSL